ncbi:MAG: M42 family metallopeptidase [Christensenellales bacterium]
MEMIKTLCALSGVSGWEDSVRDYIIKQASTIADEVTADALGNVIAVKYANHKNNAYRVMACAHMDEVGLMVTHIEESGLLRFAAVGSVDERILPAQRVRIGEQGIAGVIGCMPVHLIKKEETEKVTPIDKLYIDIGVSNKEEALALVQKGDWAVFDAGQKSFGDGLFKSKALDDRAGCAVLLKALEHRYDVTFYAVFSVQEEVGCHGVKTAAYSIMPSAAIVLEGTTCADMEGVDEHRKVTRIGNGPAISVMDSTAIADLRLHRHILQTADEHGILWQNREGAMGGTDAGDIMTSTIGVPVVNINVPCRYIHSPVSVMSISDYSRAAVLLRYALEGMDAFLRKEEKGL